MIFLVDVRYYKDFQLEMYGIPRHSLCSYVHVVSSLHANQYSKPAHKWVGKMAMAGFRMWSILYLTEENEAEVY